MSFLVEDVDYPSEATLAAWPNCAVSGCPNKCCRAKNSPYCHPHTVYGQPNRENQNEKAIQK